MTANVHTLNEVHRSQAIQNDLDFVNKYREFSLRSETKGTAYLLKTVGEDSTQRTWRVTFPPKYPTEAPNVVSIEGPHNKGGLVVKFGNYDGQGLVGNMGQVLDQTPVTHAATSQKTAMLVLGFVCASAATVGLLLWMHQTEKQSVISQI